MMKKKLYIQNSIFWQLMCMLLLLGFGYATFNFFAFIIGGIRMWSAGSNDVPVYAWILLELLWTFGMIMCAYSFINMESYIIHLNEEHVWMNGEIGPKGGKSQYKADIHLKDIREISFIRTNRNSKNESIKRAPQAYAIKRYLVFKKANGKQVWMNVSHYTNGYLAKILAELILRITNSSNVYNGETVQDIMSKDYKI